MESKWTPEAIPVSTYYERRFGVKNQRVLEELDYLVSEWDQPADFQFVDDLVAANRMKNFLLGNGIEVPKDVVEGLANLISAFDLDIFLFERGQGFG